MDCFGLRSVVVPLVASVLFGCAGQHVALTAPPRTAPLAEREKAYQDLRLKEIESVSETYTDASGARHHSSSTTWKLGNGTEVMRPADLMQVVDRDSETARHLDKYLHASDEHKTLHTVTVGTLLGGVALLATGLAIDNSTVGGVGALAVFASPIMYAVYLINVSSTAKAHIAKVPDLYNGDLSRHLGIEHVEEFDDSEHPGSASAEDSEEFVDTHKDAP